MKKFVFVCKIGSWILLDMLEMLSEDARTFSTTENVVLRIGIAKADICFLILSCHISKILFSYAAYVVDM